MWDELFAQGTQHLNLETIERIGWLDPDIAIALHRKETGELNTEQALCLAVLHLMKSKTELSQQLLECIERTPIRVPKIDTGRSAD